MKTSSHRAPLFILLIALTIFSIAIVSAAVPTISFISPTPADNSTQQSTTLPVRLSTPDSLNHYSFVDFDNSLQAWITYDDLFDKSSNSNDGTAFNGASEVSGKFGSAISFDGIDDYIEVQDSTSLNTGQFTISTWISPSTKNEYSTVLMKTSNFFWNDGYGIAFYNDALNFFVNDYGYGSTAVPSSQVPINEWTHIVGTFDGQNIKLYVNGNLIESNVLPEDYIANDAALQIGKGVGDDAYVYDGLIDDTIILSRALSSGEIKSLYLSNTNQYYHNFTGLSQGKHTIKGYVASSGGISSTQQRIINIGQIAPPVNNTNSTTPPSNLTNSTNGLLQVSFISPTPLNNSHQNSSSITISAESSGQENYLMLDFDKSLKFWGSVDSMFGDIIFDSSSYAAPTVNQNGPVAASGKFGSAMSFDGIDDYIEVQAYYDPLVKFTNSLWIYPSENNMDAIMIRTGSDDAFEILDNVSLRYYDGTNGVTFDAENVITPNEWNHIVVTSSNSSVKLYVNGELKAEYDTIAAPQSAIDAIGRYKDDPQTYFNGKINNVIIFGYDLDENEISALYSEQSHNYLHTFSGLTEGIYKFTAHSEDINGNKKSVARTIYINGNNTNQDTEPPVISIESPVSARFAYNNITIRFSINEPGACSYSLNMGQITQMGTNNDTSFIAYENNLQNGDYFLDALCSDNAGNQAYDSVIFAINFTLNNQTNQTIPTNQTNNTIPGNNTNSTNNNQTIPTNNTNVTIPGNQTGQNNTTNNSTNTTLPGNNSTNVTIPGNVSTMPVNNTNQTSNNQTNTNSTATNSTNTTQTAGTNTQTNTGSSGGSSRSRSSSSSLGTSSGSITTTNPGSTTVLGTSSTNSNKNLTDLSLSNTRTHIDAESAPITEEKQSMFKKLLEKIPFPISTVIIALIFIALIVVAVLQGPSKN